MAVEDSARLHSFESDPDARDPLDAPSVDGDEGYELRELPSNELGKDQASKPQRLRADDDSAERDSSDSIANRGETASGQIVNGPESDRHVFEEERRVIRKLDTRLVLFVAFLYMLSFLDRSNIGNAKVAGMSEDLRLSSDQFEWLLRAFYFTYVTFEWMTLLWKIFPPHIYLSVCVAAWGVIASLQALATSFWAILLLRASLGIGEAAFVGVPFYLSFFFRQDELALRTGLFIAAAPLSTTFAGTLAYIITRFGDAVPIASWRILFLVEGFPGIIVAVFVWLYIPDGPSSAVFLSPRERRVATYRLEQGKEPASTSDSKSRLSWRDMRQTLLDPQAYLTAAMFFCCNVAFSSLPVFLPTIIAEMGYSALAAQALSAPPFLAAFIAVLLTAYLSDRMQNRSLFVMLHAILAAGGYAWMAFGGMIKAGAFLRYLGVYPAAMGFFSAVTIIITWTINNQKSDSGKGTGMAMLNYIGQLGPFVGVHLYPDSDQPYYTKGMAVCAGFMAVVAVLAFVVHMILTRRNRRMMFEDVDYAGAEVEEALFANGTRRKRPARRKFVYIT